MTSITLCLIATFVIYGVGHGWYPKGLNFSNIIGVIREYYMKQFLHIWVEGRINRNNVLTWGLFKYCLYENTRWSSSFTFKAQNWRLGPVDTVPIFPCHGCLPNMSLLLHKTYILKSIKIKARFWFYHRATLFYQCNEKCKKFIKNT